MNKQGLLKCIGQHVRLQPPVRRAGVAFSEHWLFVNVDDRAVQLEHSGQGLKVLIGPDAVKQYTSDPNSDSADRKCGWLQLLVQIDVSADGSADVTPLRLDPLGVPVLGPLESSAGQLAANRYRSLPLPQRAVVAYVLMVGQATQRQVDDALAPIGYGDANNNVCASIARWQMLLQRAEPIDSQAVAVLGYEGTYCVNPAFRSALEELVARDPDLDRLRHLR